MTKTEACLCKCFRAKMMKVKDNLKDDYLEKEGYRVLRFSDEDVLTDIRNVIRAIAYEIDKILPLPPPEGDKPLRNDNE